jgi:hypothetical protein
MAIRAFYLSEPGEFHGDLASMKNFKPTTDNRPLTTDH